MKKGFFIFIAVAIGGGLIWWFTQKTKAETIAKDDERPSEKATDKSIISELSGLATRMTEFGSRTRIRM